MSEKVKQPCCLAWVKAHDRGTDNEGYGNLVKYGVDNATKENAYIGLLEGFEFLPVRFCPWCGAKKDVS